MWYVYVLRCSDNSLYTGITTDIQKRFQEHKNGKGGAYTRSHIPVEIVITEKCKDKSSALKREIQIKKLSRVEKDNLIRTSKVVI